jgi:hypothetical protein
VNEGKKNEEMERWKKEKKKVRERRTKESMQGSKKIEK